MMNRREFLAGAAMAPAAIAGVAQARTELIGNRFLTFCSVIRVNQIEAARDKNLGEDEAARHTPENVQAFRAAFEAGWPGGRMTWALSWRALHDERSNYRAIRKLVAGYHDQYGDEVTFIPGGYFANAYNTREQVNRDLHDGLARVSGMMGGGYRPNAVIAGFLAADNLRYLAENEGIHVCQGNIWSQYAIDNQDGEGSICYPYYPSREHFCKPAQTSADLIDCVNLDGWTMDFLAARRAGSDGGFNSRMGVGPIETIDAFGAETGLREMMAATTVHFDRGFELNRFAWVTNIWEVSLMEEFRKKSKQTGLKSLTKWLSGVHGRWPSAQCVSHGEFGLIWRRHQRSNAGLDYRFEERGTGIGGSDADKEIRWFMNREFRLALLRRWNSVEPERVIDFTRYDLPAHEPKGMTRRWSLMGRINQKDLRRQDEPIPLDKLAPAELNLVLRKYPELKA
jgi:hypothetical protein